MVKISTVRGALEHRISNQKGRRLPACIHPRQAGEQHNSLETQEFRFKESCQRQGLLPDSHFDGLELNFTENADWLCW